MAVSTVGALSPATATADDTKVAPANVVVEKAHADLPWPKSGISVEDLLGHAFASITGRQPVQLGPMVIGTEGLGLRIKGHL